LFVGGRRIDGSFNMSKEVCFSLFFTDASPSNMHTQSAAQQNHSSRDPHTRDNMDVSAERKRKKKEETKRENRPEKGQR
jgi:hypothetical protein